MNPLEEELIRREVERTMTHGDPVIQRALTLLGQPLNPIQVLDLKRIEQMYQEAAPESVQTPAARRRLEFVAGFRRPNDTAKKDPNIYINRDHEHYKRAQNENDALSQLVLAATLLHEQIHNTDGEKAARRKEADFLRSRMDGLPKWQQGAARKRIQTLDVVANDK